MPGSVDRCVKKLIKQGKKESSAWVICQSKKKKKKTRENKNVK